MHQNSCSRDRYFLVGTQHTAHCSHCCYLSPLNYYRYHRWFIFRISDNLLINAFKKSSTTVLDSNSLSPSSISFFFPFSMHWNFVKINPTLSSFGNTFSPSQKLEEIMFKLEFSGVGQYRMTKTSWLLQIANINPRNNKEENHVCHWTILLVHTRNIGAQ